MLIVGERINTSRKLVNEAVEKRDASFIEADVQRQVQAGAHYIDVNAGSRLGSELEDLRWLVEVIEGAVDVPLALDSPDPQVLREMTRKVKKKPLINSTTAEAGRFEAMKGVLKERECEVVALCMDDRGIPKTIDQARQNASFLVEKLAGLGLPLRSIHLDPMIQPISVNQENGRLALETLRHLRRDFPEVQTICGVSNISYGLPNRFLVNRLFMTLCLGAGLNGAIIDPLDQKMMTQIIVGEMLLGGDPFCMHFLKASRAGRLIL